MTRTQRNGLLVFVFVVAASLGYALWWTFQEPAPAVARSVARASEPALVVDAPAVAAPSPTLDGEVESRAILEASAPAVAETTVVFPLEIELEILRSEIALRTDGVPALGAAATARVRGSILGGGGAGVRAEIAFVAGSNEGRTLYCDRNGVFGANDLYPGLALVEVSGPAIPGSMREMILRQDRDTQLNIVYARMPSVQGEVLAAGGDPIAGARVSMDGQETQTDEKGVFTFAAMTPGEVLVVVDKPGFAAYREITTIPAGQNVALGRLKYALQLGARLEITVEERINPGVQAQVFVLPGNPRAQRKFPWFQVNPVLVYPGGTTAVEDLPAESVDLRVFHAGAEGAPKVRSVTLQAGQTTNAVLHIAPAPQLSGTVVNGGQPVVGARVRLEMPDRVHATLATLGLRDYLLLESEIFPDMPDAVQETLTDASGQFFLSANETISKERYLVATSPDGRASGGLALRGGETQVTVELKPLTSGESELVLQTTPRYQPLPLKIVVNGAPLERAPAPAGQDVRVEGLTPGTWRMRVRFGEELLVDDQVLELNQRVTWPVELPEGAIHGQDADTRKRAARR